MFRRHYSLALMAIWLVVGVCLLAPEEVLPEKARQHVRGPGGGMIGALAFAFAAYNFVRWWAYQSLYRNRAALAANALAARKLAPEGEEKWEPNPELDFFKPAEPKHPPE